MKEEKITCEVIQDLLPLCEDGCCSKQSKELVEEHLQECELCRKKRAAYQENLPGPEGREEEEIQGIRKGIRIFIRWRTIGRSLLCLILAVVFAVIPVWNHVQGTGLTYANLRAVHTACAFERALVSGDYEKAYGYLDLKYCYEELAATRFMQSPEPEEQRDNEVVAAGIREVEEKGFSWYDEVCREAFLKNMRTLEEKDEMICSGSNLQVENEGDRWRVSLDVRTDAGTDLVLWMDIKGNGIRNFHAYLKHQGIRGAAGPEEEQKGKMYEVLYNTPSINETVMGILYDNTGYDWRLLFDY